LQLPILPLSTHQPLSAKNTGEYDNIGDKKIKIKQKKKAHVCIKRAMSDSYLTYGQPCKA